MADINTQVILRDPSFWESPKEFLPKRFEKSEVDFKDHYFQFVPFGFGRRGCPRIQF